MLRLLLLCLLLVASACGGSKGGSGLSSEDLYGPPPSAPPAAAVHTVRGMVVSDLTGMGVPGAFVQVDEGKATTDATGAFELTVPRTGLLNAQVTAEGYWEALYQLDVAAGVTEVAFEVFFRCETTADCPSGRYCGVLLYCEKGEPAFVEGKVTSICSGKPLSAKVTLGDRVVCTNPQDGSYRFDGLVAGDSAELKVDKHGYDSVVYGQYYVAGQNLVDVALLPSGATCDDPPDVPCT